MFKKALAPFDSGKLANYTLFFGCVTLGIAAISGMACAYCGLEARKQKCRASREASDICAAKKCADK